MRRLWLVVAVGLGTFAALGLALPGRGPLGIDRQAFAVVDEVRGGFPDALARALTELGTGYVAWPMALVGCAVLTIGHRRRAAIGLAIGALGAIVAVGLAKRLIGRPRPAGGLVHAAGFSFPSGHATYATFWLAVAVLLAARRRDGRRRALIAGGAAVMVAVGVTRVYLRAHYLSDVLAGWGISAAMLALGTLAAASASRGRCDAAGRGAAASSGAGPGRAGRRSRGG